MTVHILKPDMDTLDLASHIYRCLGSSGPVRRIPKGIAMAGGYPLDLATRVSGRSFPISSIRVRKFFETT